METVLQYADPTTQRRWGPFFFIPSIRSIVLIVVFTGSFFWLRARHEPWVHVSTFNIPNEFDPKLNLVSQIPSDTQVRFVLTPDNHLLLGGRDGKVRLYDSSGRLVRNVSTVPAHYQFLKGGTQLLLLERHKPEGAIIDVFDGHVIKTVANPIVKNYQIEGCNDDASRMLTTYSLLGTTKSAIWDLASGEHWSTIKPVFETSNEIRAPQSPDWTYLTMDNMQEFRQQAEKMLLLKPKPDLEQLIAVKIPTSLVWLKDLKITSPPMAIDVFEEKYVKNYQVVITGRYFSSPISGRLEVRSVESGKLLLSAPFPMLVRPYVVNFSLSQDGSLLGVTHSTGSRSYADVFDLRKGVQVGGRGIEHYPPLFFIPNTAQFVQYRSTSRTQGIFDNPAADPLFAFSNSRFWRYKQASSDGSLLLGSDGNELNIWKHPGRDVRLSRLGIFGMPHTWLLIAFGLGTVLSLILDARRRSAMRKFPLSLSLLAGILAGVSSLYLLLWLILGRRELSPAPLLIVVIIALSLGSGIWRWISLALLGGCIFCYANLLRLYFQRGPAAGAPTKFFDTLYNFPRLLPIILFSVGSALSLLLLLAMLLRRRASRAAII